MDNKKRLFILSPTNCGSSFLSKSLLNCENVIGIEETYASEAALLPEACNYGIPRSANQLGRYNNLNINTMQSVIEAAWKRNSRFSDRNPQVLVEKSPGWEIFCASEMEKYFNEPNFILLMRNPYAFVEGIKRRNNDCTMHQARLAIQYWIDCAYKQIENYSSLESCICISYESMCEANEEVSEIIRDYLSPLIDDFTLLNKIKIDSIEGNSNRSITNFNYKQIKSLDKNNISYISNTLSNHKMIMEFFNYDFI